MTQEYYSLNNAIVLIIFIEKSKVSILTEGLKYNTLIYYCPISRITVLANSTISQCNNVEK